MYSTLSQKSTSFIIAAMIGLLLGGCGVYSIINVGSFELVAFAPLTIVHYAGVADPTLKYLITIVYYFAICTLPIYIYYKLINRFNSVRNSLILVTVITAATHIIFSVMGFHVMVGEMVRGMGAAIGEYYKIKGGK